MEWLNFDKLKTNKDVWPKLSAKLFNSKDVTIMKYSAKKGFKFSDEGHKSEQITIVLKGKFKFSVNNKIKIMKEGDFVHISPNEKHGGEALTNVEGLDIFSPKRKEKKYQDQ
jgi:quercetin dioxygenase-like cupin family protein